MGKCGIVNVSVSNHYSAPSSSSEIVTQGLLGEAVEILEEKPTHILIKQADGYQSWIPEDQLVSAPQPVTGDAIYVRSHFLRIYAEPCISAQGVRDAVIGCRLLAVDEQNEWYRVILPDGVSGWAEKKHFQALAKYSTANIVSLAKEFLGYQYAWGGLSPKGFDCSGFVQTIHRLHNISLPRDAWQQQQQGFISTNHLDAQSGDLLFFSSQPGKVTHVAISLGDQQYIHASGWVRLDSFRETDEIFTKQRLDQFISVNRYPFQAAR